MNSLDIEELNKTINCLFDIYVLENQEKDIPKFQVSFENNLYDGMKRHADSNEILELNNFTKDDMLKCNNYNGFMLCPNKENDNFLILINTKQINSKTYGFINTFIHEITHMFDFYKFMNRYGVKMMEEIEKISDFGLFLYWTEFHARYNGYKYLRKSFEIPKKEVLDVIKGEEMNMHMKRLIHNFKEKLLSKQELFTEVCWNYGRFVNYEEYGFNAIEDKRFPKEEIINKFGQSAIDIYYLLKRTLTFNDFIRNNDEYQELVNKIDIHVLNY